MKAQFLIFSFLIAACNMPVNDNPLEAPIAKKIDSVLTIHDHSRIDPYFWMRLTDEQKVAKEKDAQTQDVFDYLEAENAYMKSKMEHTEKFQDQLYEEIVGRIKKNDESVPYFKNEYWYYSRYEAEKEYAIYCRKHKNLDAKEEILLDVNELAKGKSYYAVTGLSVSPDNKILAFGQDDVSRRIYTIRFKNLETGKFYSDEITNTTGNGAWANDNKSFFYTTKNLTTLLSEKVYQHKLGNNENRLVYHEKDPSFYIGVYRSKSGKFIIIYNNSTISSDYHILPTDSPDDNFLQFSSRESNHEYSIEHFNNKFYILSNRNAINFQLFETADNVTMEENWRLIQKHDKDVLLEDIDVFENHLVITERSKASNRIKIINPITETSHYIPFEDEAYVAFLGTNPEFNTHLIRYMYSSLTMPMTTFEYDMTDHTQKILKQAEVVGGHDPKEYVSKRLFAKVRDGVEVPISLVYNKTTQLNENTPLMLYAYGSYGSSTDPYFSSTRLSLLDRGFVWAIAHIRGGEEMGRQWYEDGKMFNKINTFNDYIDCAKYLIEENYSSKKHLYAMGGSAGGLLMGAVINMAPDLFNGVIAAVPFVDVVSTMLDESIPLTTNEFDEWGNPKNKDAYDYMLSYSPYDQVKEQEYPNLLITTGLFDSQVQYWEPAKWIAKLRDKKTNDKLLIMHTDMEAGHGGASGRFARFKEIALEYAFLLDLENISQ